MGIFRMGPPDELMIELAAEFPIENFVETGTYEGETASWASKRFRNVLTIEMSEHYYEQVRTKYNSLENVSFIFGDSRTELKKIISSLENSAIFWLDAHWSGGATYGNNDQCPILEEIKIINNYRYDSFIFIDDARLFMSPPQPPHQPAQWADIVSVIEALRASQPDRYIVVIEDVIIAVPDFARMIVARHCQNVNSRLWESYNQNQNKSDFRKGIDLIRYDLSTMPKSPRFVARRIYDFIKRLYKKGDI